MMIIVRQNDGSHFELEEMGEGKLRARFQDGITKAIAETFVDVRDYPSIAAMILQNSMMMEDLRLGTPNSSAVKTTSTVSTVS